MATNGKNSGRGRPPTHGRYSLRRGLSRASRRTMIDRRTAIGKALAAWRAELLADLGGSEAVSTQELALVEEAVKTKLILDSVLGLKRRSKALPSLGHQRRLREQPSVSSLRGASSASLECSVDPGNEFVNRNLTVAVYIRVEARGCAERCIHCGDQFVNRYASVLVTISRKTWSQAEGVEPRACSIGSEGIDRQRVST